MQMIQVRENDLCDLYSDLTYVRCVYYEQGHEPRVHAEGCRVDRPRGITQRVQMMQTREKWQMICVICTLT